MDSLDYKGWRGTRAEAAIALSIVSTVAFALSSISADQWLDFLKWIFGTYAVSEVGHKASNAYRSSNGK